MEKNEMLWTLEVRGWVGGWVGRGDGPAGALAARGALPTRLVLVKMSQAADGGDHIHALIHHSDGSGAQARAT